MKSYLRNPFERMLQGLAYWLAYKSVTYKCDIIEADAVTESIQILQSLIPSGFKISREYSYGIISNTLNNKHADLVILNANRECECIIEFKLSDATNGGYASDVKKMSPIKTSNPNIDCYVIILYRKSCGIDVPKKLVNKDGRAVRKTISVLSHNIKVRRVCYAICSKSAKKMKKVVCLELV